MANTRSQQTTLVNTNLADNTTEQITPLKHREVETESITASAFVDDDNTFTGANSFTRPIVVEDGFIKMPTDLVQIGSSVGDGQTGTGCNQIGFQAGWQNTGDDCNQVGSEAGYQNTGSNCNQIGLNAGEQNTGNDCNQLGNRAGSGNTGNDCNQLGFRTGYGNTGNDVNAFGRNAGRNNTKDDGVFIGPSAGYDSSDAGYTGVDAVFAIANASIPEFANKSAADAAITVFNGYPAGSTYIYRNNQHGWIGFVTL